MLFEAGGGGGGEGTKIWFRWGCAAQAYLHLFLRAILAVKGTHFSDFLQI